MTHAFRCSVCLREYSTDATNKTIIKIMAGHAAMCEQNCRKRVEAKFGARERSLFELAELYRQMENTKCT